VSSCDGLLWTSGENFGGDWQLPLATIERHSIMSNIPRIDAASQEVRQETPALVSSPPMIRGRNPA
ncbi:MAG TPA: hypothetical protein VIJ76_03630, partial [Galbitalea sp.]